MGYYLNIDKPDLGSVGVCLGGKFFGYLDDVFEYIANDRALLKILKEGTK